MPAEALRCASVAAAGLALGLLNACALRATVWALARGRVRPALAVAATPLRIAALAALLLLVAEGRGALWVCALAGLGLARCVSAWWMGPRPRVGRNAGN